MHESNLTKDMDEMERVRKDTKSHLYDADVFEFVQRSQMDELRLLFDKRY